MLRERWQTGYLLKERGLRPGTAETYGWGLRHLEEWTGKRAEEITSKDIRAFLAESSDAPSTKHLVLSSIKSFHRFHCLEEDKPMNGISALSSPRVPKTEPRSLTRDEARRLLEGVSNPREARLIHLGLYAGTRISEALERADEDSLGITCWSTDRIHIFGKGGKPRQVPLHPAIDSEYLRKDDAHSKSQLRWAGYKLSMRTGVEFHPHDLRRTFAHRLEENDVPTYRIRRLLGHAEDVTATYTGASWKKLVGDVRAVVYQ